jgi:hypothetical protein
MIYAAFLLSSLPGHSTPLMIHKVCTPNFITIPPSLHLPMPFCIDHEEDMFPKPDFGSYHMSLSQLPSVKVSSAPFVAHATPIGTTRNRAWFLLPILVGDLKPFSVYHMGQEQASGTGLGPQLLLVFPVHPTPRMLRRVR